MMTRWYAKYSLEEMRVGSSPGDRKSICNMLLAGAGCLLALALTADWGVYACFFFRCLFFIINNIIAGSLEYRREGYEKDIRDIVEYFERNCRTKEKPILGERYGYSKTPLSPNLINFSRVLNPPKTCFNWAPA